MTLIQAYDDAILRGDIHEDGLQRQLLTPLETLANQLMTPKRSWLPWRRQPAAQGFYIYGPVGVGKTFLMDLFYDSVDMQEKKRFHFHHFMQQVDARLRTLQGTKNPLQQIADELASTTRLLCFD
ncbi:MAG: AFG1/ZapE family ATPase, partial [Prosthecobacter sp.]|nr:AFG1/ZapE family ATPase [Prosthecobacter sp.]